MTHQIVLCDYKTKLTKIKYGNGIGIFWFNVFNMCYLCFGQINTIYPQSRQIFKGSLPSFEFRVAAEDYFVTVKTNIDLWAKF